MTRMAERLGPVPPLDEVTRLRLERAVLGELATPPQAAEARRRRPYLALGAAALAAAAVALWFVASGGRGAAPTPNRHVAAGAPLTVAWGDADITVEPGGAIVTAGDATTGVVVVIERGAADFSVAPRRGRPRYAVIAGDVEVEVVGTRFRVERRAGSAHVDVIEGVVTVRQGGVEATVPAGEAWPPEKTADAATGDATGDGDGDGDGDDTAATATAPVARDGSPRPSRAPTAAPARRTGGPRAPDARAPVTAAGPADRYAEAARLEARDPAAAEKIYAELAARRDPWGATALYALAQLEAGRGRRNAATRHLRAYLDRFPDGASAADVRALLARLQ